MKTAATWGFVRGVERSRRRSILAASAMAQRMIERLWLCEITGLVKPRAAGAAPPSLHEAFRSFGGGESEQRPEVPSATHGPSSQVV